ncbi:MAG: PEP/pyruvate-binding domain-containing protein [Planctomycetota bacterium]
MGRSEDGNAVRLVVAFLVLGAWTAPALAIPSPDLVVNSLSVVAQGAGVLVALFGGLSLAKRRQKGSASRALTVLCGLFALLLIGALYLLWQSEARNQERLTRALVRSSTQNGEIVHDVDLKELKFSEQIKHPLGLTTDQVQELIRSPNPPLVYDVREDEEYAMGYLEGAKHIRYPDLKANEQLLVGHDQTPLLLCFSGNRSGELSDYFARRGITTRFMIGGYEKWFVEGRHLVDRRVRESIRDITGYPNKDVLLETGSLLEEFKRGDVVFLDTRYAAEFEWEHLPGAIDVTVRKLRSPELAQQLQMLPSGKRFVGVCYDKRSSFYSLILGAKVTALGHQWLGRYSVPWEFPTDSKSLMSQPDRAGQLASLLGWLGRAAGNAGIAVMLLALLARLVLAPLSWFTERQAMLTARLKPELEQQRRLERSGGTARHTVMELYRRHGVRPFASIAASIVQLTVFLWLFAALMKAPFLHGQPFVSGWIDDLTRPDPRLVLPTIVGGLVFMQVLMLRWKKLWWRSVAGALSAMLFLALTAKLPAAATLYLGVSLLAQIGLTLGLRALVVGPAPSARRTARAPRWSRDSIRFFDQIGNDDVLIGNKARRLAVLSRAGFRVSPGFVLTQSVLDTVGKGDDLTGLRDVDAAARRIGKGPFAVRSSAVGEDGAARSFAGIFETRLDVAREQLCEAVAEVTRSFRTERAASYSGDHACRPCILIQRMVRATYSGVLFTRHPANAAAMLVEVVPGLGESLVAGEAQPESFVIGRVSLTAIGAASPLPLCELARQALAIEQLFGAPQDIEWAWDGKQFSILQSRDITAVTGSSARSPALEAEKQRLLAGRGERRRTGPVLEQNGLSELLPTPTASSLSLMRKLYQRDGAAALACAELGLEHDAAGEPERYLETVCGRLFIDRAEERILFPRRGAIASWRSAWRLQRAARTLKSDFESQFVPEYLRRMRIAESIALHELPLDDVHELVATWVQQFVRDDYCWAELVNIVAEFFARSRDDRLSNEVTPTYQMHALVRAIKRGESSIKDCQARFGHRSSHDYELSEPRFAEDPSPISRLLAALPEDAPGEATPHRAQPEFSVLKDRAKDLLAREIALIRKGLLELGRRYGLAEDIFHLSLDEIANLGQGDLVAMKQLAGERKTVRAELLAIAVAPALAIDDLEALGSAPAESMDGVLRGLWVSGTAAVEGTVRVLERTEDFCQVRPGEILVAPHLSPELTVLYGSVAGVVTELGGMLSHAAIVAREYQLPAIAQVRQACRQLHTGDRISLNPDGHIEVLVAARMAGDVRVALSA